METSAAPLMFPGFRVDWAQRVGVELPGYEEDKIALDRFDKCYYLDRDFTLSWLEDLLVAFRDGDPDANDKVDTIPWAGNANTTWTWHPIIGAIDSDLCFGGNLLVNGELLAYNITPQYKEFLKLAARWYDEGLLDREFATLNWAKRNDKLTQGLVASGSMHMYYVGFDYATTRSPNTMIKDEDIGKPGVEVVLIPPVVGPDGSQGAKSSAYTNYTYRGFCVNARVDDAKLAKILQILDYIRYGEDEPYIYDMYGKPGVHFDWEGEPWNSTPLGRKAEDVPDGYRTVDALGRTNGGSIGEGYPGCSTLDRLKFNFPAHMTAFVQNHLFADTVQRFVAYPYKLDLFGQTNLQAVNKQYGADLGTMTDEFYLKAVTGQLDIDAEWDAHVAKWRRSGGDAVLAELMKAPIVRELSQGRIVY